MRHQQFIRLLGSAAIIWPLAVHAQQPARPVIGLFSPGGPGDAPKLIATFRQV
jgi:putative tryptophan/tyrosine transport system substrate-binding protein